MDIGHRILNIKLERINIIQHAKGTRLGLTLLKDSRALNYNVPAVIS